MKTIFPRLLAVLECLALFGVAALLFYGLRQVETTREWERQANAPRLVEYAALLILSPLALIVFRRDFARYGFSFRPVKYHLGIFASAFLPVLLLSISLNWLPWQGWPGAVLVSVIEIGLLTLTVWMLRGKAEMGAAAFLPAVLLLSFSPGKVSAAFLHLGYAYLLVAPAEEALFRGAIQSRLNLAFGRPFCAWGIRWGWGLLITSLFFGLWHLVLNPLAPSAGPQALWTIFDGLIFGVVREKSGSIAAPALLHGVLNYGPQAFLFDLFLSGAL